MKKRDKLLLNITTVDMIQTIYLINFTPMIFSHDEGQTGFAVQIEDFVFIMQQTWKLLVNMILG